MGWRCLEKDWPPCRLTPLKGRLTLVPWRRRLTLPLPTANTLFILSARFSKDSSPLTTHNSQLSTMSPTTLPNGNPSTPLRVKRYWFIGRAQPELYPLTILKTRKNTKKPAIRLLSRAAWVRLRLWWLACPAPNKLTFPLITAPAGR